MPIFQAGDDIIPMECIVGRVKALRDIIATFEREGLPDGDKERYMRELATLECLWQDAEKNCALWEESVLVHEHAAPAVWFDGELYYVVPCTR
jgi:hypothetical protein